MQNPRLASRYAKSLIDLAVERNSLEETLSDIQLLNSICTQSHDFTMMLRSPVIPAQKKLSVINSVVGGNMKDLTKAFINLLVTKGREMNLPEIAGAFITQYKEMKNIRTVRVTTAVPMTDSIRNTIVQKIAGFMPTATIEMETKVNEDLIGGFVLEVGDKLFDASVKTKLNEIRANVVDLSYVNKM